MAMSSHQTSTHSMKDALEPFHLVGTARCASRGMTPKLWPLPEKVLTEIDIHLVFLCILLIENLTI
jgi:hypothetical protein